MKESPRTARSKQPYVIQMVTKMAKEYGPGAKLPTAQKLAKQLGVTLTTLDRSLGKLESKGVIHRRQGSGIYVCENSFSKNIGMVFGRNIFQMGSSTFYLLLLQHCELRASMEQEQFSFYLSPPQSPTNTSAHFINNDLADSIKRGKLDGLLICEVEEYEVEDWLINQDIPIVALSSGNNSIPRVGIDTRNLIHSSMQALAAQGCKTVGLLGILARDYTIFEKAAKKYQLEIVDECVIHPEDEKAPPVHIHEELGLDWMHKCLERCGGAQGLPDGLLITDDILARGACLCLKEYKIRPGKDLQIASHANKGSLILEYWQDDLILAEVDPAAIVSSMFKMLKAQIAGTPLKQKAVRIKPYMRLPETSSPPS
ncbi:GntR family transcriptional regulator [Coraliomargarita algicola]|uniref:GntR family transcriptional regulator n=1 Tax=Coraliomargarita algicola TaxID=3092156 RepID=A0ABZ0RK79_9BACT|nr:GntR family transcriptional regulator [Coraliomargarita sp. J2-16]WPJ96467.1 GntR family transcriptional regulator [Coraliomargarita sp. J2-16]